MAQDKTNRRTFLSATGGALAAPLLLTQKASATGTVVAKTTYGQVLGAAQDGFIVFKGVPYAGSPAGNGRFKAPPKLKPWTGVRDALALRAAGHPAARPRLAQGVDTRAVERRLPRPERLDARGSRDGRKRPVMFYSHGGGFATGNGGAEVWPQNLPHDGAALARNYDVVVVTHNHRLGLFGYLYLGDILGEEYAASGAAGMLDIAAALEWVRDNVEAFGGDPGNVMIWGESGGGMKTGTLTAMPRRRASSTARASRAGPSCA